MNQKHSQTDRGLCPMSNEEFVRSHCQFNLESRRADRVAVNAMSRLTVIMDIARENPDSKLGKQILQTNCPFIVEEN